MVNCGDYGVVGVGPCTVYHMLSLHWHAQGMLYQLSYDLGRRVHTKGCMDWEQCISP